MPDDERSKLEVGLARVEERQEALLQRVVRIEYMNTAVGLALIGAVITALVRLL